MHWFSYIHRLQYFGPSTSLRTLPYRFLTVNKLWLFFSLDFRLYCADNLSESKLSKDCFSVNLPGEVIRPPPTPLYGGEYLTLNICETYWGKVAWLLWSTLLSLSAEDSNMWTFLSILCSFIFISTNMSSKYRFVVIYFIKNGSYLFITSLHASVMHYAIVLISWRESTFPLYATLLGT